MEVGVSKSRPRHRCIKIMPSLFTAPDEPILGSVEDRTKCLLHWVCWWCFLLWLLLCASIFPLVLSASGLLLSAFLTLSGPTSHTSFVFSGCEVRMPEQRVGGSLS